jgi:hypothetical protein
MQGFVVAPERIHPPMEMFQKYQKKSQSEEAAEHIEDTP